MTYPSKCTEPRCESVTIVLNQQTYQQSTDISQQPKSTYTKEGI